MCPLSIPTVLFWSKFHIIIVPFFDPTTAYFSSFVKSQTQASEVREELYSRGSLSVKFQRVIVESSPKRVNPLFGATAAQ